MDYELKYRSLLIQLHSEAAEAGVELAMTSKIRFIKRMKLRAKMFALINSANHAQELIR